METLYDNGYYSVIANPFEHCYYVISNTTKQVEATETAEPTALYKADALKSVKIKWNVKRGEEDAVAR